MNLQDPYQVLGVNPFATDQEIKATYRRLAKKYHPDKNPGNSDAEEMFKKISIAYDQLIDPVKKRRNKHKKHHSPESAEPIDPRVQRREQRKKYREQNKNYQYAPPPKPETREDKIAPYLVIFLLAVFVGCFTYFSKYIPQENVGYRFKIRMPSPKEGALAEAKARLLLLKNRPRLISDADSPYDTLFGKAVMTDSWIKNSVKITNSSNAEAVVCLVKNEGAKVTTVRNEYIANDVTYNMNHVDNGNYYLKVYLGRSWNPEKEMNNNTLKGGFDTLIGFYKYSSLADRIIMKQVGDGLKMGSYSTYEMSLTPGDSIRFKEITEKEFFQK